MHTYGDLSDAELLNIFGFVDTLGTNFTNPNNLVRGPVQHLIYSDEGDTAEVTVCSH